MLGKDKEVRERKGGGKGNVIDSLGKGDFGGKGKGKDGSKGYNQGGFGNPWGKGGGKGTWGKSVYGFDGNSNGGYQGGGGGAWTLSLTKTSQIAAPPGLKVNRENPWKVLETLKEHEEEAQEELNQRQKDLKEMEKGTLF